MRAIDAQVLEIGLGVSPEVAARAAPHLDVAARKWEIDGVQEVAAWLAQCAHESALFTRTEENLNYRASRLVAVWPSRFRLPLTLAEASIDRFGDGKRNPSYYDMRPIRIANYVYGGRMGNGPEDSGDGWKYRGRGYIQLTGRKNYDDYLTRIGKPDADPEIVASPHYAADSAGWYWRSNDLDRFVARGDLDGLTKAINGGLHGAHERAAAFARLLSFLQ